MSKSSPFSHRILLALEDRTVPSTNFYALGTPAGVPGVAKLFDESKAVRFQVTPFGEAFTGGLHVAVGDISGDGVPDLIVSAASGGPRVRIYDGLTGKPSTSPLADFFAFDSSLTGGVNVATADVNRDSVDDLVVAAGFGGGPHVKVFDGKSSTLLASFFAFDPSFTGGVHVASGDLDGDDRADIIVGAGEGGGPHVKAFRLDGTTLASFFAYESTFQGGVNVAIGSLQGRNEILTGAGTGGGPLVKTFRQDGTESRSFFSDTSSFRSGATVDVRYTAEHPDGLIVTSGGANVFDFDPSNLVCLGVLDQESHGAVGGAVNRSDNAASHWIDLTLQSIWQASTPPPQAARALAMVGIAMFDAVNIVDPQNSLYTIPGFTPPSVPVSATPATDIAAATAAARVLTTLFPTFATRFEANLQAALTLSGTSADVTTAQNVGEAVATALLAWRASDGSTASVSYTPGTSPGDYQLTPPAFKPVLDPQWPNVTPFGMTSGSQFRPAAPPALTSQEYLKDFNDVKALGSIASTTRTEDQTNIAHFWADVPGTSVTPPGHWFEIARQLAEQNHFTVSQSVRLYKMLGLAVADAGIVSWDAKNFYDFWRPITAIRAADQGNPNTVADANWTPLWATPNFQSYTSGHSTFSGAAATILDSVFGTSTNFTTSSDAFPGEVRSYTSFQQAADEAGRSRIYGGIHFEFDNQAGLSSGRQLGQYIVTLS